MKPPRKERRIPNRSVSRRRVPDDTKFRTTLWLTVDDRAYLIHHGGISSAIHAMIAAARAMDRPQPVASAPVANEEELVV